MDTLNIDDFYKDASTLLLALYKNFPRKIEIYIQEVCGFQAPDEFGLWPKRHMACLGACEWLAEEGLIRYASCIRQEGFDKVTLSKRAFTLLQRPLTNDFFNTIELIVKNHECYPSQSLIEALETASTSGTSKDLNQLCELLIANL